jgi:hypothetical protein
MGDLVFRIQSEAGTDVHKVAADLKARLRVVTGVTCMDVATEDSGDERIDPVAVAQALGGITLVLSAATFTVAQANKLLEQLRQALTTTNGVKQAILELTGKAPVTFTDATAEDVVTEATRS